MMHLVPAQGNRWRAALASAAAAGVLLSWGLPSCTSAGACDEAQLASSPAFLIPFEGAVDETGCTITAFTTDEAGVNQQMHCLASGEYCECYGGGLPGTYSLRVFDLETGQEIDQAEVVVVSEPAPECRSSSVTVGFTGAFSDTFFGAGGAGGAGGAAGSMTSDN